MVKITRLSKCFLVEGDVAFNFTESGYATFPFNSLIAIVEDTSNTISFKSVSDYNTIFTGNIGETEIGGTMVTKDNALSVFNATTCDKESGGEPSGDVPTKLSDLVNDMGFTTTGYVSTQLSDYAKSEEIPTKTSELTNDSGYITSDDVPTKTSELTNDSNFVTSGYVEEIITAYTPTQGFATINGNSITDGGNIVIHGGEGGDYIAGDNIDITDSVISVTGITIPTNVSELTNDANYITSADVPTYEFKTINNQEITGSGNITISASCIPYSAGSNISIEDYVISVTGISVPTKLSELTNDEGYVKNDDLTDYAKSEDIPTKTSELTNDSNYITIDDIPETKYRTINGNAITGDTTDIVISGTSYTAGDNIDITNNVISVIGITHPTKLSEFENDEGFITDSALTDYAKSEDIPTKVSELTNDANYITSADVPTFKTINNEEITGSGNITITATSYTAGDNIDITDNTISVTGITIPTKLSEFTNDEGFITDNALTDYAKSEDIPTKTSELTNDSGYITNDDVPTYEFKTINNETITGSGNITISGASYTAGDNIDITDNTISVTGITHPTKLSEFTNDEGFITDSALTDYAKSEDIPTKVSELTNDSKFITSGDIPTFKTINNETITGSGNITITATTYTAGDNIDITNNVISVTDITIPTKVSELTNDEEYITINDVPTYTFKTINNQVITGSGDIHIEGGSGGLSITHLTQAEYDELPESAKSDPNILYVIDDVESVYYTKSEIDEMINGLSEEITNISNIIG